MTIENRIKNYVLANAENARSAGSIYHINPLAILAQGAVESGWGTSANATLARNYFGILATRSWKGPSRRAATGLLFRSYATPAESFMDFARLISSRYPQAARISDDPDAYAHAIASSAYIAEENGDDREAYERSIRWAASQIARYFRQ